MLHFFGPRGRSQKRSLKNALRQALREAPGRSRLPPRRLKSINFPPQEAPRRRHMNFCWPPGRPRAAAKSDLRRSRRPPWAHMAPRSSQDPSGPSFWTLRPPSPGAFSIHFLRFPASFFEALSLPWVVLFRVRVRLRSMFRGLRRFNFKS